MTTAGGGQGRRAEEQKGLRTDADGEAGEDHPRDEVAQDAVVVSAHCNQCRASVICSVFHGDGNVRSQTRYAYRLTGPASV